MERTRKPLSALSEQVKNHANRKPEREEESGGTYKGNFNNLISTGSTLLDLAISGGRVRGGGLPGGILVEIYGPSTSGKTVLLSEIGGDVQRKKGEVMFYDPEARLDQLYAKMFGLHVKEKNYKTPDTIPELFKGVRKWEVDNDKVNCILADSLAALSTDQEMDKEEGDKMGMRRPKEFSEELRKTCRILKRNNFLMVCSNQIRVNIGAMFGDKTSPTGGEAIGFYASLRLKTSFQKISKIIETKSFHGKEVKRSVGVAIKVTVTKNSSWKPQHEAPLTIIWDYGIDDVRENLDFIKEYSDFYTVNGIKLHKSLNESIKIVETDGLQSELKEQVIDLWEAIEKKFDSNRIKVR
jgi:recombination protein RecA